MDNEKMMKLKAEHTDLISRLTSPYSDIGDWKLAKQEEASMFGADKPYSDEAMKDYRERRQAARKRINEIEAEMAELKNEGE